VARFVLLGGIVAACSAVSAADLRGFVSDGPAGTLLFQACNGRTFSPKPYRLEDETPAAALSAGIGVVRRMMLDPGRPLYIEFRGEVAAPVATAQQFQRAIGTVESCGAVRAEAADVRLLATGEYPGWRFVATSAGARLERPGAKPVRFPAAPFTAPIVEKNSRIFDAWSSQDGGSIRMEFTEQMCSDGHSGTAYGARVVARIGSYDFEGCAARF